LLPRHWGVWVWAVGSAEARAVTATAVRQHPNGHRLTGWLIPRLLVYRNGTD